MTEIYRGPLDLQKGKVPEDPYHPRYPDIKGRLSPDYSEIVTQVVKTEQVTTQVK